MKHLRLISVAIAVIISLVFLWTCKTKRAATVITIGSILPLTGDNASFGVGMRNSLELAVDKANRSSEFGKYQLRLVQLDDSSDPATAAKAARQLCQDSSVVVVTAHWNSPCALATSSIFGDCHLVNLVAGAVNSRITEDRKQNRGNIFRIVPHDKEQGRYAALFAVHQKGWKRIFIVDDQTDYGKDLGDIFGSEARSRGAEIIGREGVTVGTTEFRPLLEKIMRANPDVLYFGGVVTEASRLRLQMSELKSQYPLLTGSGAVSGAFFDVAGESSGGTYATFEGRPVDAYPGGKDFLKAYSRRGFKAPYEAYGIYAYANGQVLTEAVKRALAKDPFNRSLRGGVLDELKGGTFDTVLGPIVFGQTGQSRWVDMAVYEARGRKWAPIFVTDESGNLMALN